MSGTESSVPDWASFLGGPVRYEDATEPNEVVGPFEWLRDHPWPRKRPAGPPPVLTPEEFSEAPLPPQERERRADLLARLRETNHRWR